jgi:glutamate-1-semialdehyde 2,1-aminomutase
MTTDTIRTYPRSREILERNSRLIPGGLASVNRKADPCISFKRALGSRMWDVDGNEYIDYHAGFAPYILGHNDPEVNEAVSGAMAAGLSNFGTGPTEDEGALAELFLARLPMADGVQFFNTGSEATAHAVRVARAATGRDHLLLVQGSYNGHHNAVAANVMTPVDALGGKQIAGGEYPVVPITAGTPQSELNLMHPVEFNDLDAVEYVARKYEVALMITEPALQNVGVVKPKPGYLEGLRALADRYGFLLVFDEVKTGFRSSIGGYQGVSKVCPDLSTFGKAFANGFPIAALAGKREFLDLAVSDDPARRVLLAGTYNCHPVPVAAATACLTKLGDPALDLYGHLEALATRLEAGQKRIFDDHDVPTSIVRQGSAHCVYFMDRAPLNWWEIATGHDMKFDAEYRAALIGQGIYNFPLATKQGSISCAHTVADIDRTLEITEEVVGGLTK